MQNNIALIGYASGIGGNILGCKDGPKKLRERGIVDALIKLGHNVKDYGDAYPNQNFADQITEHGINHIVETYGACRELYELTSKAISDGNFPLILGGDHSLSIGSTAAISDQHKKLGLIWIDTHPDINLPSTSPSKNPFGMSVAFLLGLIPGAMKDLQQNSPAIDPANLVYVGLRDVDPGEKELINKHGIKAFSMKEIDMGRVDTVIQEAIVHASKNTDGFVVSFDLDVCEPQLVPGTGTPYRGGLTYREAHLIMELLYDSNQMLGLEMVELNPSLDVDDKTADFAIALIESAMGKSIL